MAHNSIIVTNLIKTPTAGPLSEATWGLPLPTGPRGTASRGFPHPASPVVMFVSLVIVRLNGKSINDAGVRYWKVSNKLSRN